MQYRVVKRIDPFGNFSLGAQLVDVTGDGVVDFLMGEAVRLEDFFAKNQSGLTELQNLWKEVEVAFQKPIIVVRETIDSCD
jgi:hypothetical protein